MSECADRATDRLPEWARSLGLQPHPEGGWYAETYRSGVQLPVSALPTASPGPYPGPRASATGILFLLNPGEESAWHRVRSDELWLHHRGGRLELVLGERGAAPDEQERLVVGSDPTSGEAFHALVPAGHWQRARPLDSEPVLVGCIVTPGFDFADFTLA